MQVCKKIRLGRSDQLKRGLCDLCTEFGRRGDGGPDGAVDVAVEEGPARVGAPELVERPLQLAVVQLGERVEPRVAAGDAVVVARGAREQSEHVRRAAERRHPRGHHRPRAGGERGLRTDC